jgi:putative membrane protein
VDAAGRDARRPVLVIELIEWWTAEASGSAAEALLGTQGDPWDTPWDMFLALVGSIASLILLWKIHDRQLDFHHGPPACQRVDAQGRPRL